MFTSLVLWATTDPDFGAARRAAEDITFDAVDDAFARSRWMDEYDYWYFALSDGDELDDELAQQNADALERLRADLARAVHEVEAMWTGKADRGDYDRHEMGPVTAILAGGESLGDDPDGDAYHTFVTMQEFGLDRVAGFYQ